MESCRNVVLNLDIAYDKAEASIKQRIVGSIFPEKFIFENNKVRTTKVNEMFDRVCRKIEGCSGNKKGQQSFYELLPCSVDFTDKISNQLLKDIDTLVSLSRYISSH
jgi:hypothetical protein